MLIKVFNSVNLLLRWIGDREVLYDKFKFNNEDSGKVTRPGSPGHNVYFSILYRIFHEL